MAQITIDKIEKRFSVTKALSAIDLTVRDREFVVLVGPSGSGKSTLLRIIAGLDFPSEGTIAIDGKPMMGVAPKDRDVAMVFQSHALYPHMTVYDNLAFNLRIRGIAREQIDVKVKEVAARLEIIELLKRRPHQMSGGQRQRVAIGRALVRDPRVFLFDEPLSNLDAELRARLRTEIKRLHRELQRTSVYVTHDQIEAMTLADRVVVLRGGRIEQVGAPDELYARPANIFVGGFIGSPAMNLVPANGADGSLALDGGERFAASTPVRGPLIAGMRPEDLMVVPVGTAGSFHARVNLTEPTGADTLLLCSIGAKLDLCVRVSRHMRAVEGDVLTLRPRDGSLHLFDIESGQRLN
ncbi:MAG: sn-glycerol-3-phosphate ABC transporter ATP-binding protein UgpC [Alphaproteobacteria bacterium]|nr:sn-glycerol-3-phosphate ABC transporter ATP-binding protein UgpC [Alphaproteobacteria bacterium]